MSWNKLSGKVNARPGRERLILTISILMLLHAFTFYILQPQLKLLQSEKTAITRALHAQIEKRSHEIHRMIDTYKSDSDTTTLTNIAALKKRIIQSSPDLMDIKDSFIDPNEMTAFIKNILSKNKLHIDIFENTPAESLPATKPETINIYRHGINIEVSGSYHNQIRFLRKLEASPWRIFWSEALIRADEKGTSTLSLSIYTLNHNSEWLEI